MIKSTLTAKNINDFWIKVYFDISDSHLKGAIKRAYRDFNRTLIDFKFKESKKVSIRENWISKLEVEINKVLNMQFANEIEFDRWHKSACDSLIAANEYNLTYGQAQKWINMTLKYLFAMGDNYIKGTKQNYLFFHIPIDNIILKELDRVQRVNVIGLEPWSKITDYERYYKFQTDVRVINPGKIPMDVEFEIFNLA